MADTPLEQYTRERQRTLAIMAAIVCAGDLIATAVTNASLDGGDRAVNLNSERSNAHVAEALLKAVEDL